MKYETLSPNRKHFIQQALNVYPNLTNQITREEIEIITTTHNLNWPQWLTTPDNKISRKLWNFPHPSDSTQQDATETNQTNLIESEEEIQNRIKDTYESLETLIQAVASNTVNSLIVSGGAGLGKSHTVNKTLSQYNDGEEYNYIFHKGYLRASHLFRLLWENKEQGQTIVIDDCDSIFSDETAMNLLKAALELKASRRIGWGSEKAFEDQDGEQIPRYFDYEGSIIFLTNKDIRGEIASNTKNSPHLSALESRSLVLDMKIKTKQEYLIKIKQTVEAGMLSEKGFSPEEEAEIMSFLEDNANSFSELSLRMVEKVSALYSANPNNWQKLVAAVCFK